MENKLANHIGESNEMVTAVEWLEKEINERGPIGEDVPTWLKELYEQAKAMEKEQIINLFKHAQVLHTMKDQMRGEQYYNETYGK